MRKEDFKGKKVLVMGLGRFGGGSDAALFARRAGANVVVTDQAGAEELGDILLKVRSASILAEVIFRVSLQDKPVISYPFHELVRSQVASIGQIIELWSLGEGFYIAFIFSGDVFGIWG